MKSKSFFSIFYQILDQYEVLAFILDKMQVIIFRGLNPDYRKKEAPEYKDLVLYEWFWVWSDR